MQLERVKVKYQRSFFDLEQAQMDYNKADASNDVSRNQVNSYSTYILQSVPSELRNNFW